MFADVVFPLKIRPLTYRVPSCAPPDLIGRIVAAPLMRKTSYGIVIGAHEENYSGVSKGIKELAAIHQHFAAASTTLFLKWLSDYYLTPMGIALKSSFFEETLAAMFEKGTGRKRGRAEGANANDTTNNSIPFAPPSTIDAPQHHLDFQRFDEHCATVVAAIREECYKAFLLPAPFVFYEYLFLSEIIRAVGNEARGIIILVPEIGHIPRLEALLRPLAGERLSVLHSRLGKRQRGEAISAIINGVSDIVVGTRSAALAPLKKLSFVAVLEEHSPSYKGEEGLRYNGRDVAVMRGFMEHACVVLSSLCPSLESVQNARIGKYTLLKGKERPRAGEPYSEEEEIRVPEVERPRVKIIDMRRQDKGNLPVSRELLRHAGGLVVAGERVLFLINRKGYSLIRCEECGSIARCKRCNASLVFHKNEKTAKCHYCGYRESVPDQCEQCKSTAIVPFGAGTERVKEEVEKALHAEAVLLEKREGSRMKRQRRITATTVEPDALALAADMTPLVIGTAYAKRLEYTGAGDEAFGAAAFLNMDLLLSQPDFRAHEHAMQEVLYIAQMVRSNGFLFMQTFIPKNRMFRYIKNFDLDGFYNYELSQRKLLDYPPFSKLVLFTVRAKENPEIYEAEVARVLGRGDLREVEILGPAAVPSHSRTHRYCFQVLMKSKERKALHAAAQEVLRRLEGIKGIRVMVDVDPLKI